MPLTSSFWVDEMVTVFVVHHGAADPSLRAAPQIADSIYYWLPLIAERIAGLSEWVYRLPSAIAMAIALLAIGKIAARLIHPQAGWFVVFGCLATRGIDFEAADARPYALGTMVLSVALLGLIRWLDSGRARDALLFAAFAAMLWWVHLVFWPFYFIFPIYGTYRIWSGNSEATRLQRAAATAFILTASAPVGLRALSLIHNAAAHVIVPPPSLWELFLS